MIRWPDPRALARQFRAAKPFRHVVIDGLLARSDLLRVREAFGREPQALVEDEIYLHLRSADPPLTPPLRELRQELAASCAVVSQICATAVSRADGSAHSYLPCHYLLPHSDFRPGEGRAIAYACYFGAPRRGGELELFAVTARGTRPAKRIAARPNRMVLFEVNQAALHQVREVLEGRRDSIAGWFYP